MRIGLDVAAQRMTFAEVVDRTRFAEGLGFDGVWGFDHFQPMYGEGPGECFEAYTTMAALAMVTERVRLGLLVTGLTYRPLGLLATEAITLDHASNGRLELAIGTAWFEGEHKALGFPFPPTGARVDLLEDALNILPRLFTEDDVTYAGKQVSVEGATINPKPVQQPSIPIWVGASGEKRSLPMVAKWADAWHCFGGVDYLAPKNQRLDAMCEAAGRDPSTLLRAASISIEGSVDDARREIDAWRDAGFGYLIAGWPSGGREQVESFAAVLSEQG
jgi:alkanesulfonate monooxygenase SsuD/methylene tetrahydromethanopterin reductase-like flavin-dependent oxidoreductase (luciferase family)